VNLIDQIDTQIIMKVMQSGRQTVRPLIIFRRTCTPAILFWAYSYAGPSNFGRFDQIFWHLIRPLTEALAKLSRQLLYAFRSYSVTDRCERTHYPRTHVALAGGKSAFERRLCKTV